MNPDEPIDEAPEPQEPEPQEPLSPAEAGAADHPHAGIAADGWSSPQATHAGVESACADIILKRSGAPTDIRFSVSPPAIIGRFDPGVGPIDVDLTSIPEGSYVSRKHARIVCEEGVWRLEDLGSSNGTFIRRGDDFERVEQAELHSGDEFALGNARFEFQISEPPQP